MSDEAGLPHSGSSAQPPHESRRQVSFSAFAILEDGSTHVVSVVDLSYDGCSIETLAPLEPGDTIRISVPDLGIIDAEVRWHLRGKAGLVFAGGALTEGGSGVGSAGRESARDGRDVTVRRIGRHAYSVTIADLSPTGFSFEFADCPEIGETLLVKFPGLQALDATVRWVDGIKAGVSFDAPIHPAVFALLRGHFEGRAGGTTSTP